MKNTFKSFINRIEDPVSVSMDSSAFDSSQHGYIMRSVDNPLWTIMLEKIFDALEHNPLFRKLDLASMRKHVIRSVNNNEQVVFINIPGVKGPQWS